LLAWDRTPCTSCEQYRSRPTPSPPLPHKYVQGYGTLLAWDRTPTFILQNNIEVGRHNRPTPSPPLPTQVQVLSDKRDYTSANPFPAIANTSTSLIPPLAHAKRRWLSTNRLYGRIPYTNNTGCIRKLQDFEIMSLACTSKARLAEEARRMWWIC